MFEMRLNFEMISKLKRREEKKNQPEIKKGVLFRNLSPNIGRMDVI